MTARPERASRIGELVGAKYRIVRMLAEGGMGVVFEAQHTVVRRRFAVKFLRPDLAERRDILTRFQREAEAAGALESENVAAAVDFGIVSDGTPYIVMEYLVGENLASLLEREGRLPITRAADLAAQASRGIEVAHASGIIHRDLKPQNLFVCRRQDGTDLLKVLDFGVAKLQAIDEMNAATRTGTVLGTVAYMSPEQARGDKIVDQRADVYALGAILYELVSQKRPHPGESNNAVLHHIASHPAVPLESVQPGLPDGLVAIVARALSADPAARPPSAGAFAEALAPFARREVWPAVKVEESGPTRAELTSTALAPGPARATPPASSRAPATVNDRGPLPQRPPAPAPRRARPLLATAIGVGVTLVAVAVAVTVGVGRRGRPTVVPHAPVRMASRQTLTPRTRFYAPPPNPGAVQQIAALAKAKSSRDAALLTSLAATPQAIWIQTVAPEDVQAAVRRTVIRATHEERVPVLVANNLPYRDCAQYSAGGASDAAAYAAWIDGFAKGIGNERVVVILEPDGLGIIPYNTRLDGSADWCRPTISDAQGQTIPAPGATAPDRYALLARAIDSLERQAPNAAVYLDGTHSGWLPVGEIAYRLAKAGVEHTQGFAVNVSNSQPTADATRYGTWISKCLAYASFPAGSLGNADRYRECPSPGYPSGAIGSTIGSSDRSSAERWYADHLGPGASSAAGVPVLAHFVIDTGRNGRGPLSAAVYAAPPFNQPPEVIGSLTGGNYCNPPLAGLGLRPTADTKVALVDAYLWIKVPGESDGSCDIAGGPRAWDYSSYNPWGITGDAQKHFDPLWGMVDPAAGEWFPEHALQLARNANPPLDGAVAEGARGMGAATAGPTTATAEPSRQPPTAVAGLAPAHAARRHAGAAPPPTTPSASLEAPAAPPAAAGKSSSVPINFDQQNPY